MYVTECIDKIICEKVTNDLMRISICYNKKKVVKNYVNEILAIKKPLYATFLKRFVYKTNFLFYKILVKIARFFFIFAIVSVSNF